MKAIRYTGIFKIFAIIMVISPVMAPAFSQNQKEIKITPYTIETTYNKLKKDYPFISPVSHDISENINTRENLVYRKIGERELYADVYFPKNTSQKLPGILLIHGGGWVSGSKENQRPMAKCLAVEGFVAVTVEYRLSREAPYPAGVIDIKAAVHWLKENAEIFNVDKDKIAILGASAGAQLATLVGVTPGLSNFKDPDDIINDKVHAIVNVDGIVSFIHPDAEESEIAGLWLGGLQNENPKNWKEASPLEYVDENSPPVLFINSAQPRFHAGRDDMIKILNSAGIYNEVHEIPDSPHSFWLLHPWFEQTLDYVINFLNKVF